MADTITAAFTLPGVQGLASRIIAGSQGSLTTPQGNPCTSLP